MSLTHLLASVLLLAAHGAAACDLSAREAALAELLRTDPGQRRTALDCDPGLTAFARARAADMAERRYVGHVDPDHTGPNDALRARGYPLPATYARGRGNNIEALATGLRDPAEAWRALLGSEVHRVHLLGEDPAYLEQDEFGIGYWRDDTTQEVDFWVIVVARRARADDPKVRCLPPPGGCEQLVPKLKMKVGG